MARRQSAYIRLAQQSLRDHHHDTEFIVDGAAAVRSDLSRPGKCRALLKSMASANLRLTPFCIFIFASFRRAGGAHRRALAPALLA